jgi:hypothetical protein
MAYLLCIPVFCLGLSRIFKFLIGLEIKISAWKSEFSPLTIFACPGAPLNPILSEHRTLYTI